MGVVIPQVITEDRASGAQIIDGSLKFDSARSHYLNRTPGSAGNRKTWTWSGWVKRGKLGASQYNQPLFWASTDATSGISFSQSPNTQDHIYVYNAGWNIETTRFFRDSSSWYHIVAVIDNTQATESNRTKLYVNGVQVTEFVITQYPSQNADGDINNTVEHNIGKQIGQSRYFDGYLTEINFIDGQALGPEYFGFTDPLTGTWRPKKYTGTYGTNGFYLPMDGNSPIGEDKSGRGNNWTPVNFGGYNTIEKATGALPILNTDGGGKVARVGVRTDSNYNSLVLALPLVGIKSDFSNAINSGTSNKAITANGNAAASSTQSNFYGGSYYFDGTGDYLSIPNNTDFAMSTGDFTAECWIYTTSYNNAEGGYSERIFDSNTGQLGMYVTSDGSGTIGGLVAGSDHRGNGKPKLNGWSHVALTRSGSTVRIFLDGVLDSSFTNSGSVASSGSFLVGARGSGSGGFIGYIQDFRVYKGVAKYTSNFIPASTNPDILPDTPSGVAGGSALTKITDGAVSFDGDGDSLSLASTSDFGFGTGDFTVEFFAYYNGFSASYDYFFDFRVDGGASELRGALYPIGSSGQAIEYYLNGSGVISAGAFSGNKWYHIALVRNSSTTTLYVDGKSVGSFSDSNTYANAPLVIGQRQGYTAQSWNGQISNFHVVKGTALYTSNFTPPTRALTAVANTKLLCCQSNTSAGAAAVSPNISGINNGTVWSSSVSDTAGFASGYPPSNAFDGSTSTQYRASTTNTTTTFTFPNIPYSSSVEVHSYFNGSIQANGKSAVSVVNVNDWRTIASGSGTLSSITVISSSSTVYVEAIRVDGVVLVDPVSANGNAAATNFNPFTTDINAVRGQESGYATFSPLPGAAWATYTSLSDGNLCANGLNTGADVPASGNIQVRTGKWYAEFVMTTDGNLTESVGITRNINDTNALGNSANSYGYLANGQKRYNTSASSYGSSWTTGDVIGVALDLDKYELSFYKNGIGQGVAYSSLDSNSDWTFSFAIAGNGKVYANFGQKPFKFPPPDGFKTLCLANLPRPTKAAVRPDKYFKTVLYTGNGSTQTISGLGFSPDLVWIKRRDSTGNHAWFDAVRGTTKYLVSSSTNQEGTDSNSLTSFTSNGFTVNDPVTTSPTINGSTQTYAAWCWKAGGAAVSNSDGSITSQVSANRDAGFSIVTWSNEGTVGHGLGVAPSFIIVKSRNQTSGWWVYASALGNSNYGLPLHSTAAVNTSINWGGAPTSSVFYVSPGQAALPSTSNNVAYCFSEVAGYSKFGSYTGNGSSDGPFVFCGFRPAWVMIKRSDSTGDWAISDYARPGYNVTNNALYPNLPDAEYTTGNYQIDIVSNGFKIRGTTSGHNTSSGTYIFAAFAEAPTQNLFGGQSNAR